MALRLSDLQYFFTSQVGRKRLWQHPTEQTSVSLLDASGFLELFGIFGAQRRMALRLSDLQHLLPLK